MPLLTEQDRWRKTGKYDLDEVRAVVPSGADVEESPRRRVDLTDCSGARWSYRKRVDTKARFLCCAQRVAAAAAPPCEERRIESTKIGAQSAPVVVKTHTKCQNVATTGYTFSLRSNCTHVDDGVFKATMSCSKTCPPGTHVPAPHRCAWTKDEPTSVMEWQARALMAVW